MRVTLVLAALVMGAAAQTCVLSVSDTEAYDLNPLKGRTYTVRYLLSFFSLLIYRSAGRLR